MFHSLYASICVKIIYSNEVTEFIKYKILLSCQFQIVYMIAVECEKREFDLNGHEKNE